jgi:hypothetical protein
MLQTVIFDIRTAWRSVPDYLATLNQPLSGLRIWSEEGGGTLVPASTRDIGGM